MRFITLMNACLLADIQGIYRDPLSLLALIEAEDKPSKEDSL